MWKRYGLHYFTILFHNCIVRCVVWIIFDCIKFWHVRKALSISSAAVKALNSANDGTLLPQVQIPTGTICFCLCRIKKTYLLMSIKLILFSFELYLVRLFIETWIYKNMPCIYGIICIFIKLFPLISAIRVKIIIRLDKDYDRSAPHEKFYDFQRNTRFKFWYSIFYLYYTN